MKNCFYQSKSRLVSYCFAAMSSLALFCLPASAYIVDNFDSNVKTGWTDTGPGTVTDAGGVFTIVSTTTANSFTYSTKTGGTYTNTLAAGHTLEFRVQINGNVLPSGSDTNTLVYLGFVPTGGTLATSGYAVAIGRKDFQILKNGVVVLSVDPTTINPSFNINSTILSLRLTESGGNVTVNARVHKQTVAGAAGQYFQETFEQTLSNDSPGFGLTGNVALGVKNRVAATAPTATFENLSFFDIQNTVIDNFSGNQTDLVNNWVLLSGYNFAAGSGDTITESGGNVAMAATYLGPVGGYVGCFFQTRSFFIDTNGGRLELSVDLVSDDGSAATFPLIGYLPGGAAGAAALREYFCAPSGAGTVYDGKQYGTFLSGDSTSKCKTSFGSSAGTVLPSFAAGRLTLIMTGEGANCRAEFRLEDTTQDINSSNRLVWAQVFVDTPGKDIQASENTGNQAPYMNTNGNMVVLVFNAGAPSVTATFDNATAGFTVQPVLPPVVKNASPSAGVTGDAKFLDTSSVVSFDASDFSQIFLSDMVVTLNGVRYTNGSPGVVITPTTPFSTNRHFALSGVFSPNANYVGDVQVTGPTGLKAGVALTFDTFQTNVFTVEMEEYNFTTNYDGLGNPTGPSGVFVDNYINCSPSGLCYSDYGNGATYPRPETICEGCLDPYAYNGKQGVPEIDFHSSRGTHTGQDVDHSFRYDDNVETERSGEVRRGFYVSIGAPGDGGFNEEELEGIRDGDWQNYTHNYPAGYYQVYLREAQFKLPVSVITLERVTTDPTVMGQTTTILGTFSGHDTGSGFNKNLPLSDGAGNPLVLHLPGGLDTLRVTERVTGNDSDSRGRISLNYMVFAPVSNPGPLGPVLSYASPPPGFAVANTTVATTATILNRDTSVDTSSIILKMNGSTVAKTVTPTATGAIVTWSLSVLPISPTITNTLIFSDGSVFQTNTWTYTYLFLPSANSLPLGSLTNRGFDVRMVQIDNPTATGNGEGVGEQMLALPPTIVSADDPLTPLSVRNWQTNVQTLDWLDNGGPNYVPGLDGGISGYGVGPYDNIATETYGYLQLKAGAHRFHVQSDDSVLVGSGNGLTDINPAQIAFNDGTYYVNVDFIAQADGLYPMRNVWHENGGYAEFHLASVNPDTAAERLVNDPSGDQSDPLLVKAYYPSLVLLYSSPTAGGPYGLDNTGVCDGNAQTMTVPVSGSAKFYKINGVGSTRVTKVAKSGSNIVLSYKFYFQPGY